MTATSEAWFTGPTGDRCAYRVDDPDGFSGGQGYVFKARLLRPPPQCVVSLKQLTHITRQRAQVLLDRDARLRELRHEGLAEHLETFAGPGLFRGEPPDDEDSQLVYIAARWVEGSPLAEVSELNEPGEALRLLGSLAEAVAYLHSRGLTHRDLHPGNVILTRDRRLVVIDLGHTREAHVEGATVVHGAPGFVPPERFDDPGSADTTSDRWQVGMLGVYLLLGAPPRGRQSVRQVRDALVARLRGHVPAPEKTAARMIAMINPDPAHRPTDLVGWAHSLTAREQERSRVAWRVGAVAAVGAGIAGVVLLGVTTGRSVQTDSSAITRAPISLPVPLSTTTPCDAAGEAGPGVALDDARLSLIASAVHSQGLCATGAIGAYGPMLVQELKKRDGQAAGAVVARDPETIVLLTEAEWGSYHQIGGKDGGQAPMAAGAPIATEHEPTFSKVILEHGWLVGETADGPHFWVPEQVLPSWQAEGGADGALRLPTSNIYPRAGSLRQDYQGGYLSLRPGDDAIRVELVPDARTLLPPKLEAGILRQTDATAWYITSDGVRHWIPNGGIYGCLGGDAVKLADDLPGYALAALPLGGVASCDLN